MATTTFQGVVRSYSGKPKGTVVPGVMIQSVRFSCDPTATAATNVRIGASATTGNTLTLPAGCIPISVVTIGAASTASGTIDIGGTPAGSSNDPDGLFNEVAAGSKGSIKGANGALVLAAGLAADTIVTASIGAVTATGGTFTGVLTYAMPDNGDE
jgi:hypothetical protein